MKLASLYIVRDHLKPVEKNVINKDVTKELNDILPQYKQYCDIKRRYQMHELTAEAVIQSLRLVCKEIDEFIHILYSSTDMEEERIQIREEIQRLQSLS